MALLAAGACSAGAAPTSIDRSPLPAPPLGLKVARRVLGHTAPLRPGYVMMGEGWACTNFPSEGGSGRVQCWEAGPSPRAWVVPWLEDRSVLETGPDRICEFARPALTLRCWQRPVRGETAGSELPESWEWLNPNGAKWEEAYSRPDRIVTAGVGGTFGCVKAARDHGVWCLGDDRFGQLGGSGPVPDPQAARDDPVFLRGVWPAEYLALGTWHGCAIAAPHGLAFGAYAACWGRGDYGQLGTPAPDTCMVDGSPVACARAPQKGPPLPRPFATLMLGDLYSCFSGEAGMSCWGASRDAFFGTPGSCPDALRAAWPTLHGTVLAPRAACSDRPVPIPKIVGLQQGLSVGPRGFCVDQRGATLCVGGIPTPSGGRVHWPKPSPGADASACALRDGSVVCWGEGYSRPDALDRPVTVQFAPFAPVDETAVVSGGDPAGWSAGCLIRRGCTLTPAPLPACADGTASKDWSEVLGSVSQLAGQTVSVRGFLGVGAESMTAMGCEAPDGRACCNHAGGPVVLGGAASPLVLGGFFCTGDDSAACCNAPAYGQRVVATGRLEPLPDGAIVGTPWQLAGASLCAMSDR